MVSLVLNENDMRMLRLSKMPCIIYDEHVRYILYTSKRNRILKDLRLEVF